MNFRVQFQTFFNCKWTHCLFAKTFSSENVVTAHLLAFTKLFLVTMCRDLSFSLPIQPTHQERFLILLKKLIKICVHDFFNHFNLFPYISLLCILGLLIWFLTAVSFLHVLYTALEKIIRPSIIDGIHFFLYRLFLLKENL